MYGSRSTRMTFLSASASRSDSAEIYLVAMGYHGREDDDEDLDPSDIHPSAWLD